MKPSQVFLLLILIFCGILVRHSDAECCHPTKDKCNDGTTVVGAFCGYGKCNIFGCNCSGGCRRSLVK
ncbi:hypothetical protein KR038_009501 [Drosophila bunnanda]|nr:hypothetical protein KR038_009501 [Drosophila bunnanda]